MPLAAELPEELKALTRRQAIEINHKQWEASTGELIRTLEGILKTPPVDAAASKQPSADPNAVNIGVSAASMAGNAAATHGNSRRWALPAVVAAVALAAAGLWMIPGDRNTRADAEKQPVGKAVEAPAVAVPPGPKDVTPAVAPSAPTSIAPAKPAAPEKAEPVPVAKPATPAPAAVLPAAALAPVIREFKADVNAARTRLCYRVSNADSLTLSPRPGELDNAASDCVEVKVDTATTFTLTARNGNATTRKTLSVVPAPADAPPTRATAPAAAPGPAATPAAVVSSSLPAKGERWVYRSSGKWLTSPKRRYEIVAQSVADNLVTDALRLIEPESGAEVRRARGDKPDFIAWNAIGPEFSPYFGAFVDLAGQGRLSGLPTPDLHPQWTNWYSKAEVIGRESVSVPAGTFNAFKVEVWSSRNRTGSQAEAQMEPVRVNYVIWYAPEIKRYVRMQRVVSTVANSESEKDVFELVAHRLP